MLRVVCDMCAGAMKESSILLYCSPSYLPDPEGCHFSSASMISCLCPNLDCRNTRSSPAFIRELGIQTQVLMLCKKCSYPPSTSPAHFILVKARSCMDQESPGPLECWVYNHVQQEE